MTCAIYANVVIYLNSRFYCNLLHVSHMSVYGCMQVYACGYSLIILQMDWFQTVSRENPRLCRKI